MVLIVIQTGATQPSELAMSLELQRSAISVHISELENQGLIERQLDTGGVRIIQLRLTTKCQETACQLLTVWHDALRQELNLIEEEHIAFEMWCRRMASS
jgi:DNA-binding MarR family transcriptional regulator